MKIFTERDIKKLFPAAIERKYPPGQIIAYQGDEPPYFYFITEGSAKYYDIDKNGNEKIIHIIGENSFFPIFYFFGSQKQVQNFYGSINEVKLLMIHEEDAKRRLKEDAEFANKMLKWLSYEVEFVMMRIQSFESNEAKQKILEALNYLVSRHGHKKANGWYRIKFSLTQQTMANLTGLSRETVNMSYKDIEPMKIMKSQKNFTLDVNKSQLEKQLRILKGN